MRLRAATERLKTEVIRAKTTRMAVAAGLAVLAAISSRGTVAVEEVITIIPPNQYVYEKGAQTQLALLEKALRITAKNAGVRVETADVKTGGDRAAQIKTIAGLVKNGAVDVLLADAGFMMELHDAGVDMHPFISIKANGSHGYKECLFVRKDDNRSGLRHFRGATISGWGFDSMRMMLYDASIDSPVHEHFGKVVHIDGFHISWLRALEKKEIDGFVAGILGMSFALATQPALMKNVKPLVCSDYKPFPAILISDSVSREKEAALIRGFSSDATKSAIDKHLSFFTAKMKWRLELVSEAEWDDLMSKALKVRAMAAAMGWTKEPTWSK